MIDLSNLFNKPKPLNLLDLTYTETILEFKKLNFPNYRAKQVYKWARRFIDFDNMSDLPKDLREKLKQSFVSLLIKENDVKKSKDGTVKYLFELLDGNLIETVLLKQAYGNTVCVSTQVGCRMGCAFCASTLNGLERNLTAGEILAQVIAVNLKNGGSLENRAVTNVVLMGIGEPLDNYDNVLKFLKLVNEEEGINISLRNITVSTCGLVEGIKKLANSGLTPTLALSLHSPFDEARKLIMPVAMSYKISEIIDSLKQYFDKTGRRVIIEYCLIEGVNVSEKDAEKLKEILKELNCHINLINLNKVEGKTYSGVSDEKALEFLNKLESLGLSATMRRKTGSDIEGSCGQLRAKFVKSQNTTSSDTEK